MYVNYEKVSQSAQGDAPFTYEYLLTISVDAIPVGANPEVGLNLEVMEFPGGDVATAASYVTFSHQSVSFSSTSLSATITVRLNVLSGSAAGDFKYKISTIWPDTFRPTDTGSFINMTVNPPGEFAKPTVQISSPDEGAQYTHVLNGPAVEVPIAVAGEATESRPVKTLVASITAVDAAGDVVVPPTELVLEYTGVGSALATGEVNYPATLPGTYTITATATNDEGSSTTTSSFVVNQTIPGPTVTITEPPAAVYEYYLGGAALVIPFKFEGRSFEGGIQTLTATLDGETVDFVAADLGALTATGTGSFTLSAEGTYTLAVTATDSHGSAAASTSFQIRVIRPTPQIVINTPANGTSITHTSGTPLPNVDFTFTVTTTTGFTVSAVRATLDGSPLAVTSLDGLNTATTVGGGTMTGVTVGDHTLVAYGTSAGIEVTTSIAFTVVQVSPPANTPPTVVINSPAENSVFILNSGSGGSGCGTWGGYGHGDDDDDDDSDCDRDDDDDDDRDRDCDRDDDDDDDDRDRDCDRDDDDDDDRGDCSSGAALSIPLTFTGSSTTAGAVITNLTAKLGTTSLIVTATDLNQPVATGAATMKVTAVGTYTITVTATDAHGTATTTRTFSVKAPQKQTITGTVFFDVNLNGTRNTEDYGMSGVKVKLLSSSGSCLGYTCTDSTGSYTFSAYPGSYIIEVADVKGMAASTPNDHDITVTSAAFTAPDTGYGLKFSAIRCLRADGYSHGFWKNNVDKAIAGKTNGVQVSAKAIKSYTTMIGSLALDPYQNITLSQASGVLSSNSSAATSLLSKQLIAAEYNYANGGYIGDDRILTYAFVYYGEYVLKNASSYSTAYITFVKDWMDAYNNSHGDKVYGPLP